MRPSIAAFTAALLAFALMSLPPALGQGQAHRAHTATEPSRCGEIPDSIDIQRLPAIQLELAKGPPVYVALQNPQRLAKLLATRPPLNICHLGMSPLMIAVASGNTSSIAMLLQAGADPDLPRDSLGGTALHTALGLGQWDAAVQLLDAGADPLARTDRGITALHELAITPAGTGASAQRQTALALRLLQRGANPNAVDQTHGNTPLMLAALTGKSAMVELLLAHGAQAEHSNHKGRTALSLAELRGHHDVVQRLRMATGKGER